VLETVAESFSHLQDLLYGGSWDETLGRHRSPFVFRGMAERNGDRLVTSLMGLGGPYTRLERHLLRNFRKYAHRSAVGDEESFWHWLAVAQHHGLPTRLLDWTYSPFVALHFATNRLETMRADGVIWKVNYHAAAEILPGVLARVLEEEGSNVFTAEMLSRLFRGFEDFDRHSPQDFLLFFEPPSLDDRIVNQFGLFSVISSNTRSMDSLLSEYPRLYERIILPAELKWEVRDKLDQANITERVLFPGLDGLSMWLRRHYSPSREPGATSFSENETNPETEHAAQMS